jgi:DNA-binding CsgD family transcriptional regulator
VARAKKDIDEDRVAQMAYDGASDREIGDILGCDHKTVANRFSPLLRKKRAERRLDLRRVQTEIAKQGNAVLLIWLGKQELGQVDKIQQQQTPTHVNVSIKRTEVATEEGPGPDPGA